MHTLHGPKLYEPQADTDNWQLQGTKGPFSSQCQPWKRRNKLRVVLLLPRTCPGLIALLQLTGKLSKWSLGNFPGQADLDPSLLSFCRAPGLLLLPAMSTWEAATHTQRVHPLHFPPRWDPKALPSVDPTALHCSPARHSPCHCPELAQRSFPQEPWIMRHPRLPGAWPRTTSRGAQIHQLCVTAPQPPVPPPPQLKRTAPTVQPQCSERGALLRTALTAVLPHPVGTCGTAARPPTPTPSGGAVHTRGHLARPRTGGSARASGYTAVPTRVGTTARVR